MEKTILDYAGNVLERVTDCPACDYINGEFSLPCGIAYRDDMCMVSQGWQYPIVGMFVISPIRCVALLEQLTTDERNHMFEIVDRVLKFLRNNNVAQEFNVIWSEKAREHFHIWILPRDGWKERGIDSLKDIRQLHKYAIENMRTKESLKAIMEINEKLRDEAKNWKKEILK